MSEKNVDSVSRRNFFRTGMGVVGAGAGALLAGNSLAQVCSMATGQQALGPFFPRPGTPELPIKEDSDPATPIYLANDNDLTFIKGKRGGATGQVVYVKGVLTDESCRPVPNATLIIWQASASGRYNHRGDAGNHDFQHPVTGKVISRTLDPFFQYWGQATTSERGEYTFKTVVPGFYPANLQSGWYRPPHIHFLVSAMGFSQFVTQMYFRGERIIDNDWIQELNQRDFLLQDSDMTSEQREALVVDFARESAGPINALVGRFNITLTGQNRKR